MRVDDLSKEIAQALKSFTSDIEQGLEKSKKESSENAVKELKSSSPKKTGSYAKGWRVKRIGSSYVVHNKTDYQLTHLLEKGHAKRGGGRVWAIPHIKPVEERAIIGYEKQLEKVIRG